MAYIIQIKKLLFILVISSLTAGLLAQESMAQSKDSVKSREVQSSESKQTIQTATGFLLQNRVASTERIQNTATDPKELNSSKVQAASADGKIYRDPNLAKSTKSNYFSISSATAALIYDHDLDGYYSEFSVTFDADTSYAYADVYALMYISQEGGDWTLYHTTNVFEIQGYSYYDEYTVTTQLGTGYPPADYDILIDLYDNFDGSYVATISADDVYDLAYLPLEDVDYDTSSTGYSSVSIFDASISLLTDTDNDGFYHSYSMQFDADVDSGITNVYAEVWMRDSTGTWYLENTTEDIQLDGNSTLDTYIFETTLESGYNTGYYDFKIEIYDSVTDAYLISSEGFDYELSQVPLEDMTADQQPAVVTIITSSTTSIESGGAGSMEWLLSLMLLISVAYRYRERLEWIIK